MMALKFQSSSQTASPRADKAQDRAAAPNSLSLGRALLSLALAGAVSFLPKRHMAKLKGGRLRVGVGKGLVVKQISELIEECPSQLPSRLQG